jgi:hypothetical protein
VLTHEALLEEALGLSMAKARAEVAFGATWGTGVRIGSGGSGGIGLGVEGRLRAQFGGC